MRFHTYSKFSPESADAVDLQKLLDNLADFLLQSGFAGGGPSNPWGDEDDALDGDRSLDALKQAILDALIKSGQFTPEMLEALRGDGDEISEQKLSKLLDEIVQRLMAEGFLKMDQAPQAPAGHQSVFGKGGLAHIASMIRLARRAKWGARRSLLAARAFGNILRAPSSRAPSSRAHERPF